jgi:hypothetical protein
MSRFLSSLVISVLLATTSARADDKAACLDAASTAQRLRAEHMLVQARDQLRLCAAAVCPAVVQSDCAEWLAEVEKALPSVVVSAKTRAGADRVDVNVTVDGQPFLTRLDGRAVPMNAGPHVFHFEASDGAHADLQVVVREGQQSQSVAIVLDLPSAPPPPELPQRPRADSGAALPPPPATGSARSPESGAEHERASRGSPWIVLGWALGGAGVIGLGVGAASGLVAMADKGSAQCNASHQCQPGPLSHARTAALASDIGFGAGAVLLASGVALVLAAPPSGAAHDGGAAGAARTARATVRAAPVVGPGVGAIVVGGSW